MLFENYGTTYNPTALTPEEAQQLVRYCSGIITHPETSSQQRHQTAKRITVEQSRHSPNLLVGMLNDSQHLGVIVDEIIVEAVKRNTDYKFLDAIARMAAAALANKSQREGAARVLTLEQLCGIALKYVAPSLRSNDLYPAVSGIFKKAAEKEQYRPEVFKVLNWATGKDELAMNAAFLLSTLADKYGWDVGTKSNTATQQLFAAD